ncbi:hypothetical protein AX27061_0135 [Achromobacter xylosoxidans NBRC 15126 = ATCC 27061]|nr:hypothetical protein AX27061_0135 [Achromobacter xylosoxidans NBRC 15126 = ATCC 27061]
MLLGEHGRLEKFGWVTRAAAGAAGPRARALAHRRCRGRGSAGRRAWGGAAARAPATWAAADPAVTGIS